MRDEPSDAAEHLKGFDEAKREPMKAGGRLRAKYERACTN